MKLRYTPQAYDDLYALTKYIAEDLNSPDAAMRIADDITNHCALLKQQPYLGASLAAKIYRETDLRYFVCGKRLIFYRIDKKTISVVRILDARIDYLKNLFGNEKDDL